MSFSVDVLANIAIELQRGIGHQDRFQRLITTLRQVLECDASALLRYDSRQFIPLAIDGLAKDVLGRRFALEGHPRLEAIARRLGRNIDSIPAETLRTLSNMEWPGNVRELENVIERAVLLTRGNVLQLSLPDIVLPEPETPPAATVVALEGEDEYQLIVRVLKETNGVVAGPKGAAQRLGLKRTTLLSRMKRLGIDKSALI